MSFGEKLRAARERRGYTQQQIADIMEIDKSTYCGYETGKRQPDVQKIKLISKILGISGDELLETGFMHKNTPTPEKNEDGLNVVRIADRDGNYKVKYLTDEQYAALSAMIDQLPEVENL